MKTITGLTITRLPHRSQMVWVVTKDGRELGSIWRYRQTKTEYHPYKVFAMPNAVGDAPMVGFVWPRKGSTKFYPDRTEFEAMIAADAVRCAKMNFKCIAGEIEDAANLLLS